MRNRIASIHIIQYPLTVHNNMSQPASTTPQTRQKTNASITKKTQKELENAEGMATDVRTKEQAVNFLTSKDYLIHGNPVDLPTLSYVLLQLASVASRGPKALTDGIRAVAFLLTDANRQQTADAITTSVKSQLDEYMESFAANVETMRDAVEHVTAAAKEITGKMDDFKDGFQETAEQLTQATQDFTEKTTENLATTTATPPHAHQAATYASAAQQQIPTAHASAISRGDITDKQILIQKDKDATDNALEPLSEKDLVVKANTTLDLMGIEADDKPLGTTFVGARKLRNGSVLYQLSTKEAASWLKQDEVRKSFMANYGGTSNMRNKLYYVIAEFVPTTFEANSSYAHARVEEDSGLYSNTIAYSKYIKPAHLRTSNQKVAHVIYGFNSRNGANLAIEWGMFVEGKHVNVRKMLTEPRRCLKCQKFGHYVPDCKATNDICARCGEQHRTSQCTITDTTNFCCTNCTGTGAKGHGAADRDCAAFKAETEKIQKRIPENKYKYFPTELPRTWQLLNEPDTYTDSQQQQYNPNATWHTPTGDPRYQQRFMDDWQEVRRQRGRPPPMQHRQTDNGWPVKPTQTTLDNYIDGTRPTDQSNAPRRQNPPRQNISWADQVINGQDTELPSNATRPPTDREQTPLDYV